MTKETLLRVFKKVSLMGLSDCEFEYGDGFNEDEHGWKSIEEGLWINAMTGGKVVDAIKWDGNIFWMMNNDGSMSPLNPMMPAFIEARLVPESIPEDSGQGGWEAFKELDIYLDDLSRHTEKDCGNLWIQFTDKLRAFKSQYIIKRKQ